MPTLAELVDPPHTAVLTMELQRGVTGDLAAMQDLAAEIKAAGVIDNVRGLLAAARSAGARVVHCCAAFRPDMQGAALNCRMLAAAVKLNKGRINLGEPGADVMPELDPQPSDIVLYRLHGMTPFIASPLDQMLRNMGVTTVIATGNSVNIGVLGLCISAVDLGYQVVLARDAVAGVPKSYADAVIDNTLTMLTTVTTTADIISTWRAPQG
jgi:nicotinamidase-related amidase